MIKSVQDFYSSLRILEEFGPDSSKNVASLTSDETGRLQDDYKPSDTTNYEGLDTYNETSQEEQNLNLNNGSQKPCKFNYLHKSLTLIHYTSLL